jgi:deazaflavin-dependent oxidoreductase (nitroreductase family)
MNAEASMAYLTTTGRKSGRAHEIEIWFALHDGRLYLLAGGRERSDWVRNLMKEPRVSVRVEGETREGRAALVAPDSEEDTLARRLLDAKYHGRGEGKPLTEWARTALPVVVTFE